MARSVRVRRQGLEPRTRGLRVRCSVRLFSLNCCHAMLARAGSCHLSGRRDPRLAADTGWCRGVPGHPSKHGANIGGYRSRPPWSRASGCLADKEFGDHENWYRRWREINRQPGPGAGNGGRTVRDPRQAAPLPGSCPGYTTQGPRRVAACCSMAPSRRSNSASEIETKGVSATARNTEPVTTKVAYGGSCRLR